MGGIKQYAIVSSVIAISIIIYQYSSIQTLQNDVDALHSNRLRAESAIVDYGEALDHANRNIQEANAYIDEAMWYAWTSYDEMGEALDALSTVPTVSRPSSVEEYYSEPIEWTID